MAAEDIQAAWSIADYVGQVFAPCVAIGCILPAGGSILSAMVRAIKQMMGFAPVFE